MDYFRVSMMTTLMMKCMEQKMYQEEFLMVKCWVVHMDHKKEGNLGGCHWERHWDQK